MNKHFKIKYDDFICPNCGTKLYIPNIIKQLRKQHEVETDAYGYTSFILSDCECGNRYKFYCDCHEWNDRITVCVNKIKKLAKE